MPVTQADLQDFHLFASNCIANSGRELSFSEIAARWDAKREYDEAVEDIRQGIEDEKAGRIRPLAEVANEIREELGSSK